MLTKRIIPCLDVKDGRVVKGVSFENLKDSGDPVELAKFYEKEGVDELVFLDITATSDKRKTVVDLASKVAKEISIPFTIGGGIKTIDDIKDILKAGADKVSIESSAVTNPDLISQASKYFGSQAIVISVSAKRRQPPKSPLSGGLGNEWTIWIKGGRENTGIDVSEVLNIPLIASSGAGELEHFYDGIMVGADAVLAASVFHTGKFRIKEVKEYLSKKKKSLKI